jgi:hypothetical protein
MRGVIERKQKKCCVYGRSSLFECHVATFALLTSRLLRKEKTKTEKDVNFKAKKWEQVVLKWNLWLWPRA